MTDNEFEYIRKKLGDDKYFPLLIKCGKNAKFMAHYEQWGMKFSLFNTLGSTFAILLLLYNALFHNAAVHTAAVLITWTSFTALIIHTIITFIMRKLFPYNMLEKYLEKKSEKF